MKHVLAIGTTFFPGPPHRQWKFGAGTGKTGSNGGQCQAPVGCGGHHEWGAIQWGL